MMEFCDWLPFLFASGGFLFFLTLTQTNDNPMSTVSWSILLYVGMGISLVHVIIPWEQIINRLIRPDSTNENEISYNDARI